jgi:hypothetical protein
MMILAFEAVGRLIPMATIAEVEKLALDLPETERAALAAHLLGSLRSVLTSKMKASRKLCVAMRNLRRIQILSQHAELRLEESTALADR